MKRITTLIITFFIVGTMFVSAYAITPGRWDFEAGYAYAKQTAEEMAREETEQEEPEQEEPEQPDEEPKISQSQMDMLDRAISDQIAAAKAFWKQRGR